MPAYPASESESQVACSVNRNEPERHQTETGVPRFRQYRAPTEHGRAFIEPALGDAASLIAENRILAESYGSLIGDLRGRARRQAIESACQYTGSYRDTAWASRDDDQPIIMAGHQPALFHPGVWFKNFALSHLAGQTNGLAINLVVDNDVATGSSIRVPTVDPDTGRARAVAVPYDVAGGGVPYEQTTIRDRDCFDSFAQRVQQTIAPIVPDPSVHELWKHAVAAVDRCGVAGCALAQSRHGLEEELGLKTLEVPLSVLCRGTAFSEFVLAILGEMPRFRKCYNESADLYRRVHGIRSSAHPVPNLIDQDGWFEAPLWIYGDDAPGRRPAWVRLSNDELIISDRPVPLSASRPERVDLDATHASREIRIDIRFPRLAAEQLAAAIGPTFKLRPRALLTTMYARLVLSDLFLHGIGGAKYDQLGDMIIRSFFAVEPPAYMVISATVKLPDVAAVDHKRQISELRRKLRDTRYQPERFASLVGLDPVLIEKKLDLLKNRPSAGSRKAWHDELTAINRAFSEPLTELRSSLNQQLAHAQKDAAAAELLGSREHPFCLFPLEYLTETFEPLLH